jgi:hypothetical protein
MISAEGGLFRIRIEQKAMKANLPVSACAGRLAGAEQKKATQD